MKSIRKVEFSNEGSKKRIYILPKKELNYIDLKGKNSFCIDEVLMDISPNTKGEKIFNFCHFLGKNFFLISSSVCENGIVY